MYHKLYLILAHHRPSQLQILINKLNDSNSIFIIHVDKGSNIADFKATISLENVHFIEERISCIWGNISIVQATLVMIEFALKLKKNGHLILLSGACMPLASNDDITKYLSDNQDVNFIDIFELENFLDLEEMKRRFLAYTIHFRPRIAVSINPVTSFKTLLFELKRVLKFIAFSLIEKRYDELNFLKEFRHSRTSFFSKNFAGSQWWALNQSTAEAMLAHTRNNPANLNQYKFTHSPDEIFFHTLLMNLPHVLKNNPIKHSITYTEWSSKNSPSPITFSRDNLPQLIQKRSENYFFARKFDIDADDFFVTELPLSTRQKKPSL
ncbi:beta-1,6-N-acetylglucosaminyltransferase [Spirosoma fluviale]|uniref:Peptide O-xylosyltransferase n=1 Tax=Spirosoma fluviale TaxID=1597977 RepID=A0A286FIC8_9BACT|nr:beta-1,6-N-acetylglucosaminyltransferase [Spirosoma fluviale]SOD82968.1 Core-2/I-Branching enzyme [Spirosoma fluviale]